MIDLFSKFYVTDRRGQAVELTEELFSEIRCDVVLKTGWRLGYIDRLPFPDVLALWKYPSAEPGSKRIRGFAAGANA